MGETNRLNIDVISLMTDHDDKVAYANTKKLAAESEFSDIYYDNFEDFVSLLNHEKSYIRTRALILCCSQARWDTEGKIAKYLPDMLQLLHDVKPTVVRQSLNAFKEVIAFRPELSGGIKDELELIDLTQYKESMVGLIAADATQLRELIEEE